MDPSNICFGERHAPFALPRTLYFSLSLFYECSLLLAKHLTLVFHSYVVQSLLVFLFYFVVRFFVVRLLDSLRKFSPRLVSNKSIGVGKSKKFHAYSDGMEACVDCDLDFSMSCFDIVFNICLVVIVVA